jgi:hypothetical protein
VKQSVKTPEQESLAMDRLAMDRQALVLQSPHQKHLNAKNGLPRHKIDQPKMTLNFPVDKSWFVKLLVNPSRIVFEIGNQSLPYSLLNHQLSSSYLPSSPLIHCTSKN